jgi:hypothetical protein
MNILVLMWFYYAKLLVNQEEQDKQHLQHSKTSDTGGMKSILQTSQTMGQTPSKARSLSLLSSSA